MISELLAHANECLERLGTRADDPRPLGLEFLRQQLVNPRNSWTFDEAVYQEWGREGLEIANANMDRLRAVLEQPINLLLAAVLVAFVHKNVEIPSGGAPVEAASVAVL